MQHLEVSGAVLPLKWPLGVKWLTNTNKTFRQNELLSNLTTIWGLSNAKIPSPFFFSVFLLKSFSP